MGKKATACAACQSRRSRTPQEWFEALSRVAHPVSWVIDSSKLLSRGRTGWWKLLDGWRYGGLTERKVLPWTPSRCAGHRSRKQEGGTIFILLETRNTPARPHEQQPTRGRMLHMHCIPMTELPCTQVGKFSLSGDRWDQTDSQICACCFRCPLSTQRLLGRLKGSIRCL